MLGQGMKEDDIVVILPTIDPQFEGASVLQWHVCTRARYSSLESVALVVPGL